MVVLNFFILKHCSTVVTQTLITASVVRVKVVRSSKVHIAPSLTAVTGVAEKTLKHWSETSSRTCWGEPCPRSDSLRSPEEPCHSVLRCSRRARGSVVPALQPTSPATEARWAMCLQTQRSQGLWAPVGADSLEHRSAPGYGNTNAITWTVQRVNEGEYLLISPICLDYLLISPLRDRK